MNNFYYNDKKYEEICEEHTYIEMNDEELEYCVEVEKKYYMPKIMQMIKNHWTLPWIIACVHDLYMDYLIYEDFVFYTELAHIGIKCNTKIIDQGYGIYENSTDFDFENENPLRD